ncbi:MAG: hypothetical protein HOQ35_04940, partial [Acidobacteriaceae bacterium]|nr:hypothetical protein [Acidobacteriaceae bacterium]
MNALAAVGRIAVCLAFSIGLSAQTPTITVTPTGTAGVYTLAGQYTAQAQAGPPTGNVTFEDTTYSNAVLGSAPFSSSVTSSIAQNGSQSFTSLSGYYYSNVFVRDFDGDGKVDVLFIGLDQYLHFFKGNGDETFQAGITDSSVTMQTTLLAVGDWNGDGKLDIAASSGALVDTSSGPAHSTTLIRLGNGDGTFQAPTQFTETISQSCHQVSLRSGDFNGDGKPDLFSNMGCYPSHLYLGNGDGTFAAAVDIFPASGPIADFNNDGRADIYESNYTQLGLSNGTFQSVNHTSGPIGTQATAADFNHDGKLDIAGFSDGNAMVSFGNGDGTFQAVSTYNIDPGPLGGYLGSYHFSYMSVASGDFNGDGLPDLAFLGNYYSDSAPTPYYPLYRILTVLFGRSDGSFSSPQTFTDSDAIFSHPHPFLSVDLTGSGIDTLLEFYPDGDDTTQFAGVRRYTAANTFTATATNVIVSPGGTHQVRAHYAGDANYGAAISTTQAVTGSTSQATLSLAISPNPSTYGARADMTVTVTPCTVGSYSCDSDWVDIYDGSTAVASGYPSGGVAHVIWRNFSQGTHLITARIRGNTNLSSATSNAVTLTVGPPLGIVSTLTLADPQQVGSTYTLSAQLTTPALDIAPTGSVSFVDLTANNSSLATATFGPPTPVLQPTKYTSMTHLPGALYAADFDNDGKADLIYPVYPVGGNSIAFLHGNGDGTFSGTPTADGFSPSFAVADFDHDGKLDVVLTGTSGLSLLRGNGDGTFATATTIGSGDTSYSRVFVGDFNGDGKQDIYNRETLFLGNGDGTFQRVIATGVSGQLAADFNHDGRTDLFAYGTLYLGQSDGTFTAIPAPTYYTALIADFNHDGNPDLFTGDAVVLGNGDGTFQALIPVDLSDPYGYSNGIYFTGDFNGDGKADLGMATAYAGGYHVPGNYFVSVTFGDGTGAFGNKISTRGFSNQDVELPAIPTYLPDFNGDTTSDIPVYTQAYIGPPLSIAITLYTAPTVYTATATGITVNGPPYGYHSIQATYPGDTNYLDETSNTATIIAPIPVTVTLAVNRNPINTGQQVTFTATLSPFSDGNQMANGTISFSEGSTILGTGTLNNGVAQFTTSSLSAGSHSIIAQFPGWGIFGQAASTPLSMQVGPTAVNITWSSPAAITYGTALSSTQLNASTAIAGSFTYSPVAGTVLVPGTQTLSATFTPTDTVTYSTTTATTTLVVNKATPSIAVTQTSPATTGTNVGTATTLLATLAAGYGTPTGTVTFYDGPTSIGAGTLSGNTVSITTTFTTAGTHTITAVYSGNTNFNTVTSPSFSEVVSKITPTITWPTPAAITYGTALSATQLNATGSVTGAFVYSP